MTYVYLMQWEQIVAFNSWKDRSNYSRQYITELVSSKLLNSGDEGIIHLILDVVNAKLEFKYKDKVYIIAKDIDLMNEKFNFAIAMVISRQSDEVQLIDFQALHQ